MTKNPYLKRLLGEDAREQAQAELATPPETMPPADEAPEAETPPAKPQSSSPNTQQLAKLWQSGDHVGVATSLMFADASYRDLVNLVYIIGQPAGLELGQLLDELAQSESGALETPPEYRSTLKHAIGGEEAGVI